MRGPSNKYLITSSCLKSTIKFVFDLSRHQHFDGCTPFLRVLETAFWFRVWLHLCNLKKWVTISTVATVQKLSFEPILPKPTGKSVFLRCECAHDTGTAVLNVDTCRASTSWHNLHVCHENPQPWYMCTHSHLSPSFATRNLPGSQNGLE